MRVYSTIAKLSRHQMICLMLLLVAMLSSCVSEQVEPEVPAPPVVEEPDSMSLLLACAPENSTRALTRLADEVVQLNDYYRKITNFRFVALKNGVVTDCSIDNPSDSINHYSGGAAVPDFRYYHSTYCSMTIGSNGCLVYAKADNSNHSSEKSYNGSLNAVIPNHVQSKEEIQFNLDPILDATEARETGDDRATWEVEAWTLANALTAIIDESHDGESTLVWKTSTNVILKNLLQRFTNNGADLPGSAASVKQWMLSLSATANSYLENPPTSIGDDEKTLLGIIKAKADEKAATITVSPETSATLYPRDINLPDGAAALRWTGEKFEPQMQTTTLDDINSVSRFVYPPALYYFVESGLWTSNTARSFDDYKSRSTWKGTDETVVQTLFSDGGEIKKNTKTVAIADPLQYAVAHLTMGVQAEAASLPYETGNENKIDISKLTLKGVIIGGQRPVDYKFEPISNSQYDVSFVYDSQVNGSLHTTPDTYQTLALQSYDGENVNIVLEFEYSGTTEFKCLNGYVYPGTRFYLVGEVKLDANALNEEDDYKKRVFTQDYTTTIDLTVKSLEKAYNVLPSLLSNSLEIGVMITPQWISAEPSGPVILD